MRHLETVPRIPPSPYMMADPSSHGVSPAKRHPPTSRSVTSTQSPSGGGPSRPVSVCIHPPPITRPMHPTPGSSPTRTGGSPWPSPSTTRTGMEASTSTHRSEGEPKEGSSPQEGAHEVGRVAPQKRLVDGDLGLVLLRLQHEHARLAQPRRQP